MGTIAIVTDSNSGITQTQGKELGVYVLPMPFYINDELFLEDISLSQEAFYEKLADDTADIKTSQPSPADVTTLWDQLLEEYDQVVHIPMSSGLSGSCETAMMLAGEYEDKVEVVNNQRISVTQRQSVLLARQLVEQGNTAAQIKEQLEQEKLDTSIYIAVDTLKYLKKGGRITPAAAAIGTVLNLKPVLQIQGEKLDAYTKVRGFKQAKRAMLTAMEKDITHRFGGLEEVHLQAAYTCDQSTAKEWKEELEDRFNTRDIYMDRLSLSVACHIGPGALAIACTKKNIA
ncbi:MAG: DegV family protein [Lachnospiraceae bacterium]